jgi:ATP-dependent Lhr-like helicase
VFPNIDRGLYMDVLRRMGHPEVKLVYQAADGTLLPGEEGERVINERGFYAVFMSPDEFKVITDRGKTLGSLPVDNPVLPEQLIIFAGRRWKVVEIDAQRKEILVTAAHGGKPPPFGGDGLPPHDEVVAEMRRVYEGIAIPTFLDGTAVELLTEARETFDRLGLRHHGLRRNEDQLLLFPWVGNRAQMAFILALATYGIKATSSGIAVVVPAKDRKALGRTLGTLAQSTAPDAVTLARLVPDMKRAKFDGYLGDDLLARCYASERIDAARVPGIAADLLGRVPPGWDEA